MFNLNAQKLYNTIPKTVLENLGEEGVDYLEDAINQTNDSQMSPEELKEITQELLLDAGINKETLNDVIELFFNFSLSTSDFTQVDHSKINPQNTAYIPIDQPKKKASPLNSTTTEEFEDKPLDYLQEATKTDNKLVSIAPQASSVVIAAPKISAFSQSSRFHTETLQTLSNEVNLKDVNLIVNDIPLLEDTLLQLKEGFHYGFIGKNGTGKTTLLSCVANKTLLGFPENIRVQLIEQLEVLDSKQTVLEAVLNSDEHHTKIKNFIKGFESALELKGDLVPFIDEFLTQEAQEKILQAQKLANFRTGKRGLNARKAALEKELYELKLVRKKYYTKGASHEEVALKILEKMYKELHKCGFDDAEARALEILYELGFNKEMQTQSTSSFSGGWRMRVALAKALYIQPDILLLDEPTNHLDMHSIIWLTEYLKSLVGITLVVVSHDRKFLNDIAQEIILLKDKKLSYHSGNYDAYEKNSEDLKKKKIRQYENIERKKKHINESIQKGLQQAKASGDDKKLGMVASRQKKLERMGAEKTEDGKRWKVSYYAGFHIDGRIQVELEKEEKEVVLKLPEPEELRHQGSLLRLTDIAFKYTKDSPIVLQNISIDVEKGTRVAFLGPNGCGKSTLINVMKKNLVPTGGKVEYHSRLKIGHFDQHFIDMYSQLNISSLQYINDLFKNEAINVLNSSEKKFKNEQEIRAYLGSFGLSGSLATQQISTLSGGQKARFALAMLFLDSPQLLLLDEITNHLDMRTITGLIAALKEFKGGIVMASHDQHFVSSIAKTYYVIKNKTINLWEKDLDSYVKSISKKISI
ncbi:hypothetical protein BB561_003464 [Smittium simulii]|uniref:ABC transporter domain-containing protein n=1 Tax=Smittium simulii TaxID=133385 RepID=A0A2T9YLF2_9FUNG|nr:hypothetical protein BB561_003464 [Smittium simulii]